MSHSPSLFGPDLPPGMRYEEDVLSVPEEATLLDHIRDVVFSTFEMRGAVARRKVAFFGEAYDATLPTGPFPPFLLALRSRLAAWAGVPPDTLLMALINEYTPGSPIGWHRDAPQYGLVVGLSLGSECRMRLRPYVSPGAPRGATPRRATHELRLAPRSCYLLSGPARSDYEHSIPPVEALRYSITYRTRRAER